MFKEDIATPLEKAVYYTEHLIKRPHAPHLKSHVKNLSWIQFALLDVIALISSVLASTLILLYWLGRGLFILCCRPTLGGGINLRKSKTKRKKLE